MIGELLSLVIASNCPQDFVEQEIHKTINMHNRHTDGTFYLDTAKGNIAVFNDTQAITNRATLGDRLYLSYGPNIQVDKVFGIIGPEEGYYLPLPFCVPSTTSALIN
jgi:hypothetical protein